MTHSHPTPANAALRPPPTKAWPFILLQGTLFGSSLVASRFAVGQFNPAVYVGLRALLASLCHLGVYLLFRTRRLPRNPVLWRKAALLGVFGTAVPMTAIVTSVQYQSAGLTGLLLTTGPAFTVVLAHLALHDEPLSVTKIAGVILALGGALSLALRGESGLADVIHASPLGYGLALFGILASSAMTVYARKIMPHFDAFDVASVRMFTAALTVLPLSLLLAGLDLHSVNSAGVLSLAYAAVFGTFGGFLTAMFNVKRFGATAASLPQYVIPVVSGLGGALLLGEEITSGMLVGMALIGAGLALINRGETARRTEPGQP